MAKINEMAILYSKYCSGSHPVARMITVYIEESSSGTGLNAAKPIKAFHKSIEDRAAAAKRFIEELDFKCEVVLDTMKNEAVNNYEVILERILIVQHGAIVHEGGKGPLVYYDIDGVLAWLAERDTREKVEAVQETEEKECKS